MNLILGIISSYCLGSIPTAYWFGRVLKGIDIRDFGSGNVGATNAFRVLGKLPGSIILILDILKGVLAITVIGDLFGLARIIERILLGLVAVAGHNWTLFLRFKGGKGIATSLGVLIGLAIQFASLRPVLFICLTIFLIAFLLTGYVSLGSILGAGALPVVMLITRQPAEFLGLGVILGIWVIFRHRTNIQRLRSGTESRVPLPYLRQRSQ